MAQIDVTELLSDPDFVDKMIQIKRVAQLNSYGENLITECLNNTVGSIQPISGDVLQRLPEALRSSNVKSFWVKGEITATDKGSYTDILVFKGKRYQVQHVFDWTNWGPGYSEGVCVFERPS